MVAGPLKRMVSNIEVERKFNPGSKFASLLAECTWKEPQARRHKFCDRREGASFSVSSLPGQLIRNTYYDTADERLSKLGLWVRQRYVHVLQLNPARLANKEYSEVHGERPLTLANGGKVRREKNVSYEVLRLTGKRTRLEDLRAVADLQTRRSVWEVMQLPGNTAPSARMTVVMDGITEAKAGECVESEESDKSAFNHTIGEVELFQTVVTEGKDSSEHDAYRKEIAAQMMKELGAFMLAYPDIFSTNPMPLGKPSAYYTWKAIHSPP